MSRLFSFFLFSKGRLFFPPALSLIPTIILALHGDSVFFTDELESPPPGGIKAVVVVFIHDPWHIIITSRSCLDQDRLHHPPFVCPAFLGHDTRILPIGLMQHVDSMVGYTTLVRLSPPDITLVFCLPCAPMPARLSNIALLAMLAGDLVYHPLLPLCSSFLLHIADHTA